MEAGRELDALVAEKVMGWDFFPGDIMTMIVDQWMKKSGAVINVEDFRPSTDISAAWLVVDKVMHDPVFGVGNMDITRCFEKEAGYGPSGVSVYLGVHEAWATEVPHAICLAALAAVGEKR